MVDRMAPGLRRRPPAVPRPRVRNPDKLGLLARIEGSGRTDLQSGGDRSLDGSIRAGCPGRRAKPTRYGLRTPVIPHVRVAVRTRANTGKPRSCESRGRTVWPSCGPCGHSVAPRGVANTALLPMPARPFCRISATSFGSSRSSSAAMLWTDIRFSDCQQPRRRPLYGNPVSQSYRPG